jgi:1-acyl-sn-glycerol-3-phosphate acyltransferase
VTVFGWAHADCLPVLLRSIWIWFAGGIAILFWIPLLSLIALFDAGQLRLRTGRWLRRLARVLARIYGRKIHVSGLQNIHPGQTYVIVSNHQSLADIPVVSQLRIDAKWIAKAELFRIPGLGWMFQMARDIPVDRSDRRQGGHALLQAARFLRQHCSVVFFPEGTRSPDGEVLPFIEGPFQLAIREHIPILPLVVDGTRNVLPRSSWIFGDARHIHLQILEPVSVDGWQKQQSGLLRDEVRQRVVTALEHLRAATAQPALNGASGSAV